MSYDDMRVKYLFLNLPYPSYLKLQIALFICWIVAGLALLAFRGHDHWLLANAWWICLVAAVGEAGEAYFAIKHAKKKYDAEMNRQNGE